MAWASALFSSERPSNGVRTIHSTPRRLQRQSCRGYKRRQSRLGLLGHSSRLHHTHFTSCGAALYVTTNGPNDSPVAGMFTVSIMLFLATRPEYLAGCAGPCIGPRDTAYVPSAAKSPATSTRIRCGIWPDAHSNSIRV